MKKRLHDKKAGIAIFVAIFIFSLVSLILSATVLKGSASNAIFYGEAFIDAVLSLVLIIFSLKGKDRIFYILCAVWCGYFVVEQLYSLPVLLTEITTCFNTGEFIGMIGNPIHLLSVICIIAIGALLVEYMNDGSIYNKPFNVLCFITAVSFACLFLISLYDFVIAGRDFAILVALMNLSRMSMVFCFTFLAYDNAKAQLKKRISPSNTNDQSKP